MMISEEAVEAAAASFFAGFTRVHPQSKADMRAAIEAAAPFIRAQALSELAAETQERSDTFMKTMQHMADSREYSADDVLRYGAYAAEANTTAYRLRARAAEMRRG